MCGSPMDCPEPSSDCDVATCVAGACGVDHAMAKTPCTNDGGKVCDGAGNCVTCLAHDDCPASTTLCQVPTCSGGACGVKPAQSATPCNDSGGKVCDDNGQCVQCLSSADCVGAIANQCLGGLYTEPSQCSNGKCVLGKTVNCTMMKLACTPSGCMACTVDADCGMPTQDSCKTPKCLSGACEATNVPQGTDCASPNGSGTCNASGTCLLGKYVFVTTATVGSNFGGTQTADDKCQGIAQTAGLGGTWLSWTSDSNTSPSVRFTPSLTGPYRLLNDSTIVANNWASLTSGGLIHGIDMTESHTPLSLSSTDVWTGTLPNGTYSGASCGDWKGASTGAAGGTAGLAGLATGSWTNAAPKACDGGSMAHIYCFQQ